MNQLKKGLAIVGKYTEELVESLQARIRLTIRPAHQGNRTNAQITGDSLSLLGISNNASQQFAPGGWFLHISKPAAVIAHPSPSSTNDTS